MQIKNLASGLAVAAVTLVSFSSSAIGISKVMSPWQPKSSSEVEVPKVKTESSESTEAVEIAKNTEKTNSSSQKLAQITGSTTAKTTGSTITPRPTLGPVTSVPVISPTKAPANPNQCLVTLFGIQYDVSPLRSTHGGGDIFVCNSDMTITFQSRHMDIAIMAKYKVSASGTTGGSTTGGATVTPGVHHEDNDLDDDSGEHEEENESNDNSRESSTSHETKDKETSSNIQVVQQS